jgi:hypothetical protein
MVENGNDLERTSNPQGNDTSNPAVCAIDIR